MEEAWNDNCFRDGTTRTKWKNLAEQLEKQKLPFSFWRDTLWYAGMFWGSGIAPGDHADSKETIDKFMKDIKHQMLEMAEIDLNHHMRRAERQYHFRLNLKE